MHQPPHSPQPETPPAAQPRPDAATLDDDTLAFVRKVFGYARTGDAEALAVLLGQGLPPNLRNERGDSLLMLASYHGHLGAARAWRRS
jgi:ankyrin repeat protein